MKKESDIPLVSVLCVTYNHGAFIRQALDGFLMQKTNFPYEICLGEDGSRDDTKEICRKYVEKNPDKIRLFERNREDVIYINNQPTGRFNFIETLKECKGEYIALCDGDDYWVEPNKLQIQIDEMKNHPEIDVSFHSARLLINDKIEKVVANYGSKNKIFTTAEVIRGDGGFSPTNSLIFRKKAILNLPEWFYKVAPVGDFYLQIFGSISGGALYIAKNMSIYRVNSVGSWSERMMTEENMESLTLKSNITIELMGSYLEGKFIDDVNFIKSKNFYKLAVFYLCNDNLKKFEENISKAYNLKPSLYRVKLLYFLQNTSIVLYFFKKLKKC
jgi:glycosyltransferase involved in cell wall biosynthesis